MLQAWHLPVAPFIQKRNRHLIISLWLAGNDLPQTVLLRYEQDNEEWLLTLLPLPEQPGQRYRRYRTEIPLDTGQFRRRYCFKLLWRNRQRWFGPLGWSSVPLAQMAQFAIDLPDPGPQWVADQVFYQIFPDRFAPGIAPSAPYQEPEPYAPAGAENYAGPGGTASSAGADNPAKPAAECAGAWSAAFDETGNAATFFGGNLHGVVAKLPWLTQLGVTALYLNPIFTAPSVHKYDVADYRQVDAGFGGDGALRRLRKATRRLKMRMILDGVFNHTGETHSWFDRYEQTDNGACHHPDSPRRDWYNFTPEGRALDWKGHPSLPKLDYASPTLAEEMYLGRDSVVRHWLRAPWHMDGWRLDVVHMLGEGGGAKNNLQHIGGITRAAKSVNPQSYILGEHFGDARPWLQTDAEDAAMNYRGFTLPVWGFLAGKDIAGHPVSLTARDSAGWMEEYRAGLSHQQQLRMFNQLDSHDTARFITVLGAHRQRLPLGVVWLFCWPGVPCIYYGDEVGLDGGNDPFCRKPFPWRKEQQDLPLLGLYRRLAALRHDSLALRYGGCQVLVAGQDTLVFFRIYQQERVLVAIQRDQGQRTPLPWSPLLARVAWRRLEGEGIMTEESLALPGDSVTVWRGEVKPTRPLPAGPAVVPAAVE